MIYLDSAATSFFRPPEVLEAVAGAMTSFGNPSRGGCGPSLLASRTVFQAREALNRLFDGDGRAGGGYYGMGGPGPAAAPGHGSQTSGGGHFWCGGRHPADAVRHCGAAVNVVYYIRIFM